MRLFMIFLIGLMMMLPDVSGQTDNPLTAAFSSGNVNYLKTHLAEEVEISLNRNQQVYDQKSALTKLESFFNKHRPTDFINIHEGEAGRNSTGYMTGDLKTGSGTFRVFVYFEDQGNKMKVKEIRIDQM